MTSFLCGEKKTLILLCKLSGWFLDVASGHSKEFLMTGGILSCVITWTTFVMVQNRSAFFTSIGISNVISNNNKIIAWQILYLQRCTFTCNSSILIYEGLFEMQYVHFICQFTCKFCLVHCAHVVNKIYCITFVDLCVCLCSVARSIHK